MSVAIRFENVSKRYKLGVRGGGSLREAASDLFRRMLGKRRDNPADDSKYIWALKDVSFEVKEGEALGIIGPNGAGKTTILKLLSNITKPSSGNIWTKGRISALIEIGAGFHPDLTGRENIYLSGSILGLSKKEIERKFESIVEFSGLENFIDTPVKRYSSGMYVRLGFAVAAHIEPDILLIDEVLAVGDIAFQRKCLQKIQQMRNSGVTIVFVSHDLESVRRICPNALFINNGEVVFSGKSQEAIEYYLKSIEDPFTAFCKVKGEPFEEEEPPVRIEEVKLYDVSGVERNEFKTGDYMRVEIRYLARKKIIKPTFTVGFFSAGQVFADHNSRFEGYDIKSISGHGKVNLIIKSLLLLPGLYEARAHIADKDSIGIYDIKSALFFVREGKRGYGLYYQPHLWEVGG